MNDGSVPPANSDTLAAAKSALGAGTPAYFRSAYIAALSAPLPQAKYLTGGFPRVVLKNEFDLNGSGLVQTYQPAGRTITANNAFFASLGTNGRSCATCHQPPSGMSVSLSNITARFRITGGTDPIFAPIDGADCPNLVPSENTSGALISGHKGKGLRKLEAAHSLLLSRGVFRIFLPVPPNAEYTISVVSDPTGCNLSPDYNQAVDPATGQTRQIISVFRRPRMSTNLIFATHSIVDQANSPIPPLDPLTGEPLSGAAGDYNNGNIMWDGREPTLESQAINATLSHAQALAAPSADQVAQIVRFERGLYSAQSYDFAAGLLNTGGATGGATALYADDLPPTDTLGAPPFDEFTAWSTAQRASRQSIARGQAIFEGRSFTVGNVAGLNNIQAIGGPGGGPVSATCAFCHNETHAGSDAFPVAQHDIGVGGDAAQFGGPGPSAALPIFQLVCPPGSTVYNGVATVINGASVDVVRTNDPGKALITGKCADIGRRTVPQIRAMASRPPFFSDGSAATMDDVVNFYNQRFAIGLSAQDHTDLVNFLNAL